MLMVYCNGKNKGRQYDVTCGMKHDPHALVNVQALSEPQRAKHRRKVYSCRKAGMTKYAAAKKCRIQATTVGRW